MTVTMTSEAVGKQPGETYTGSMESWLLAEGYAKQDNYSDDTSAVLTGGSNAVTIVTGGVLKFKVNGVTYSVTLASSDTAAAAATKIDTALAGHADAAITGSKLVVTTNSTGRAAEIVVVSGAGTTLANLGLTVGTRVNGGDGGVGTANTGATAVLPAKDPTLAANREPLPAYDPVRGLRDPGKPDPAMTFTTADDDPNDPLTDPAFDFDAGGVNDDLATFESITPSALAAAGGTHVTVKGQNFKGTTGLQLEGATAFTSVVVVDDRTITAVSPAKTAGTYDLLIINATGTKTVTDACVTS